MFELKINVDKKKPSIHPSLKYSIDPYSRFALLEDADAGWIEPQRFGTCNKWIYFQDLGSQLS